MKLRSSFFLVNVLLILRNIQPCFCEEADQGLNSIVLCIDGEREALLSVKKDLIDPSHRLSSWNAADELDCCKWAGVVCDNFTGHVHELRLGVTPLGDLVFYKVDAAYEAYEKTQLGGKINPSLQHLKHLRVLDLSYNNFGGISIPTFIGSLVSLQHLNLSEAGFAGVIPSQIGNLSSLRSLGLASSNDYYYTVADLQWLSGLHSLTHLDMSRANLTQVINWLEVVNTLPSLLDLRLSSCGLYDASSSVPDTLNFSSSLTILDISYNSFGPSIPGWIFSLHNLVSLNIGNNAFEGVIPIGLQNLNQLRSVGLNDNFFNSTLPNWFDKFIHLEFLSIPRNKLEGPIPKSISRLCRLKQIDLSSNSIGGSVSEFFQSLAEGCAANSLQELSLSSSQVSGPLTDWLGQLTNLQRLDLSYNSISGLIPESIGQLTSLQELSLVENQLSGPLPKSLGHLSELELLDIDDNKLDGIVSEVHVTNLSNLRVLSAPGNSLILNVSRDWIPHFRLEVLDVRGWKLGPRFPLWLQSQKDLLRLDISSTGISDSIPMWLWNMSANFQYLSLSHNQIWGHAPVTLSSYVIGSIIDLSSNNFDGPLPILSPNVSVLDLSDNSFSGDIAPIICQRREEPYRLRFLNLQNNILSGEIPDCWMDWPWLSTVWLGNNSFSGRIPSSIGNLRYLTSLHLYRNSLSGKLPLSLQNCSGLTTLDLKMNSFTGKLPAWIGKYLPDMKYLSIRSNRFDGEIPKEICHLASLQILDIALNNLSGVIPTCFKNFTSMIFSERLAPDDTVQSWNAMESIEAVIKGSNVWYTTILGFVTIMDLSSNNLLGDIPNELMGLLALRSLNLSRNQLTGMIPEKIGSMSLLESLDLSWNQLSGEIPPGISNLTFLSDLNLSNNNLSGKIPSGTQLQTFYPSSFTGNNLCGPPLTNKCGYDGIAAPPNAVNALDDEGNDERDSLWLGLSIALGFVVGFWGVCGPLSFNKSWRMAYSRFLDRMWEIISAVTRCM